MKKIALAALLLTACDDPEPPCDPHGALGVPRPAGCVAALIFASRDIDALFPTRAETERYFDRWRRTIEAEPILELHVPQIYRRLGASRLPLHTTNPNYIAAWSQGILETGDVELDAMLHQLGAAIVEPLRVTGGSYESALFRVDRIFSEEYLAAALVPRSTWMDEPMMLPMGLDRCE